jgi:hypothetical protein
MAKTQFAVWRECGKMAVVDSLEDMKKCFSKNDLKGATIQVIYGCIVVGEVNTNDFLEEVYHEM